ncbi:MAG: ATP phosphoribosyltransferase regulatory subunit [Gammaproteobacteria bacterium]|nr:MAG: ATP phosphoribosyltransferase regulatory subunit [Gammaproteobacteria bacterium]
MTMNERWLLPEGIEETLPAQARRLELLRRALLDLFSSWGYELVMPPFIDYLESLLTGTGKDLDLQIFKLTDQLTGRTMGVRADMTPQVARIDAHHQDRQGPVRLCYLGTVLHARPEGLGRSRSPLQVGAELYGYSGIDSDVEILQLMLQVLDTAGISDIHVDLGHVGIFRALARQAGLDDTQESELFDALQRKARPEIETRLSALKIDADVAAMLTALVDLNGAAEVLADARKLLKGADGDVLKSLDELQAISDALINRGVSVPIHYDLAELRGYSYHTGAVFAAYVPRHGQAIAQGGRYDDIGQVFGRARPATGFSADLKTLMLLSGNASETVAGIFAPASADADLLSTVAELRSSGERVIMALPDQAGDAVEMGCDRQLVNEAGRWTVVPLK